MEAALMTAPKRPRTAAKKTERPPDDREIVIVLKDTPEYREWFDGLSEQTLIAGATIVRDALAAWAEARGLTAPPSGPRRRAGRPRGKQ